jgi:uncharacterized membrane protein YdbT with pleckstrin-like domain
VWTIDEHIQKDEKILYIGSPAWIGYFTNPALFWLLFLGFVFALITIWTIIIPIFLIVISYLSKSSTIYAITDKRVIGRQGIISENFKSLTFEHITSIRVKKGILGKMFDFGDIIMYPSGMNRMYWGYVKNPVQVKNEMEKHIK